MTNTEIGKMIQNKAYDLGYAGCGIVPLEKLNGYGEKLGERIRKVPESAGFYEAQKRFIDPREKFPWAKSVVITAEHFGVYKIPQEVKEHIGKHYLFDARIDESTQEFQAGLKMESYMHSLDVNFAIDRKFGLVALRWAAMQAGIGLIRRNNFLYTKFGSWVSLQAWLVDQDMERYGSS